MSFPALLIERGDEGGGGGGGREVLISDIELNIPIADFQLLPHTLLLVS